MLSGLAAGCKALLLTGVVKLRFLLHAIVKNSQFHQAAKMTSVHNADNLNCVRANDTVMSLVAFPYVTDIMAETLL